MLVNSDDSSSAAILTIFSNTLPHVDAILLLTNLLLQRIVALFGLITYDNIREAAALSLSNSVDSRDDTGTNTLFILSMHIMTLLVLVLNPIKALLESPSNKAYLARSSMTVFSLNDLYIVSAMILPVLVT